MPKGSLSMSTHKSQRWCASTPTLKTPPYLFWCTASLHWLIQIFGHGVRQAEQSEHCSWRGTSSIHGRHVQSQGSLFRNITLPTGYMRTNGSSRLTQFLLVCMCVRFWALFNLQQGKDMDSPLQKWLLAVLNKMLGVRHYVFMVRHAWVWIGTLTVQFVSRGNAAV
jgi:hypothetical protein